MLYKYRLRLHFEPRANVRVSRSHEQPRLRRPDILADEKAGAFVGEAPRLVVRDLRPPSQPRR
jgi:hypothetical protein